MDKEVKTAESKPSTASRYLSLYVSDINWEPHLNRLYNKIHGGNQELYQKAIACTVLLPLYDRSRIPEVPENLLFGIHKWTQFNDRDWVALLKETIKQDKQIDGWRSEALSLGIVYPLDYSPVTRQAFKWLYGKAEETGVVTPETKIDIQKRFERIVLAYGGNVVCSIFLKHEHKLKKILNWRTAYFFEKIIYEVYTVDQVIKIKKAELAKTNPKLVKQIRQD